MSEHQLACLVIGIWAGLGLVFLGILVFAH
jgi:hypothetical protein